MLEAYERPEDDDLVYGNGFKTEEKMEQAGERTQADATVTAEKEILPEEGRLPWETLQPGQGGQ